MCLLLRLSINSSWITVIDYAINYRCFSLPVSLTHLLDLPLLHTFSVHTASFRWRHHWTTYRYVDTYRFLGQALCVGGHQWNWILSDFSTCWHFAWLVLTILIITITFFVYYLFIKQLSLRPLPPRVQFNPSSCPHSTINSNTKLDLDGSEINLQPLAT